MVDAGDLGKLPPEIRKQIYTYLLVENDTIAVKRFSRAKSNRKYDTAALRRWWTRRSSGILLVNRLIRQEAAPVLYGCNKFEFLNALVLHHFLEQIGDAKRHLRHVAMHEDGLIFMKSWKSMKKAIQILASVKGLRTLEVSLLALCRNDKPKIQIRDLVHHCKPLLKALDDDFVKKGLNTSVFDIIKISLGQSICETRGPCTATYEHPRDVFVTDYTTKKYTKAMPKDQCGYSCSNFGDENNKLKQELKAEIAKQLKLQLP